MKLAEIAARARKLSAARSKLYQTEQFRLVIGHLAAKKLIFLDMDTRRPRRKMRISDVLWVGANIEPRALEVLPAALVRFPSIFRDPEGAPEDLREALLHVKRGDIAQRQWRGIPLERIAFWLNAPLGDGRSVPFKDRRIVKSFRLKPGTIQRIEDAARKHGISQSEVIDSLIEGPLIRSEG